MQILARWAITVVYLGTPRQWSRSAFQALSTKVPGKFILGSTTSALRSSRKVASRIAHSPGPKGKRPAETGRYPLAIIEN
jgi:hypothetical protein